ncbi:protein FAM3B-like [Mustelus asterias]
MGSQFRLLANGRTKFVIVMICCVTAWYFGISLADCMMDGTLQQTLSKIQGLMQKVTQKEATSQKDHKCHHQKSCPEGTFAFLIMSGSKSTKPPEVCFRDEILLGSVKDNVARGMNIAIVEAKTGKLIDTGNFDLWEGENSKPMTDFVKKAPDGSLILMATFDDASSKLTEEAKKCIEALGSKKIWKLAYRGNWVFLGTKGFTLPKTFQREKIINSGDWVDEIQIDGCFSPKTDYL